MQLCACVLLQVNTAGAEYPTASRHQMEKMDPAEAQPVLLFKFVHCGPSQEWSSSALNQPATQPQDPPAAAYSQALYCTRLRVLVELACSVATK